MNSSIVIVVSSPSSRREHDHVGKDLVVAIAAKVQALAAALGVHDRADGFGGPGLRRADLHLVLDLDPIAGLELGEQLTGFGFGGHVGLPW